MARRHIAVALAAGFFSHYLISMMFAFGLIFLALPILDIVSLIKAGALWGFWPTVGLVLATAFLGATIVRHQGFSIGRSVQQSLNAGRLPVIEAFNGACVLVAGALLLFPGLLSDVLAMLLLLPPVRTLLRRAIAWRLRRNGETTVWVHGYPAEKPAADAGGAVIEGEFEKVESPPADNGSPCLPPPAAKARQPSGSDE